MSWGVLTIELELVIVIAFMIFFTLRFNALEKEINDSRKQIENDFRELILASFKSFEKLIDRKINKN